MVLYFTGTGNSRFLAQYAARELEDTCIDAAEYLREKKRGSFTSEKPLVFAFPTYAWRMPRDFEQLLRQSTFDGCKKAYFIMTCGAETGNAQAHVQKLCEDMNLDFMGFLPVVMPDNYVAMYTVTPEEQEEALIQSGMQQVSQILPLIAAGQKLPMRKLSLLDKAKTALINPTFYRFFMSAKKFTVSDTCISCGKCEKSCPLGNITLTDGKPQWSDHCTHCMACISICPKTAIEYGSKTKGRRRYHLSEKKMQEYMNGTH